MRRLELTFVLAVFMQGIAAHAASGPVITTQPTNQTVLGGDYVSVYVNATGNPLPEYQWFFNGAALNGQNSQYLIIVSAQTTNQGDYFAVVSNSVGVATSQVARLTVITNAPEILEHPTNLTVTVGQFAEFSVMATGLPPPTYQWRFEGEDIMGRTGSSLFILADETNAGNYSVVVANSVGAATSQVAVLTVDPYPLIALQPTNVALIEGQDTRLRSAGFGRQPLFRQWYQDDVAVANATNDTLSLLQIRLTNAGNYYFVVSNELGAVTSEVATVSVTPAPTHAGAVDIEYYTGTNNFLDLRAIVLDSQQRVVAAGLQTPSQASTVTRIGHDGRVDSGFVQTNRPGGFISALAIQPDDTVIAGGNFGFYGVWRTEDVARLNADGTIDTNFSARPLSFGFGPEARSVAMQSDGRVLVGNYGASGDNALRLVYALLPNGALDPSFSLSLPFQSFSSTHPQTLAVGPNDEIMLGDHVGAVRRHSDGSADSSFVGPRQPTRFARLANDGSIYVGGSELYTNAGFSSRYLARLTPRGEVDSTFQFDAGLAGRLFFVSDVAIQQDGKVVVVAALSPSASNTVVRLQRNGQIDPTFAECQFQGTGRALAIQNDGGIVVAGNFSSIQGYTRRGLVRLLGGVPAAPVIVRQPQDTKVTEGGDGVVFAEVSVTAPTHFQWYQGTEPLPGETRQVLRFRNATLGQTGEYLMIASNAFGRATSSVARVHVSAPPLVPGAVDSRFETDCNGPVYAVAETGDGKFIIGGRFTRVGNHPRNFVARLNGDGSVDETFDPGAGPSGLTPNSGGVGVQIDCLAVDAAGEVYVGGNFTNFSGVGRSGLVRLELNGAVDLSFQPATVPASRVRAVAPLAGGRVLACGAIWNGQHLVRLNPDGSIDQSFRMPISTPYYGPFNTMLVEPGGKILVASSYSTVFRVFPDGALDTSFSTDLFFNYAPFSMRLLQSGDLLVGGRPGPGPAPGPLGFLYRLGPDGRKACAIGPCFDVRSGEVNWVSSDTCDRILVGGRFTSIPSNSPPHFARLQFNGQPDPQFTIPALNGAVLAGLALRDGGMVIAGEFTKAAGVTRNRLALLRGGPYSAPVIGTQPAPQTVGEGHALTLFSGVACVQPSASIQWYRDGVALAGETNLSLRVGNALRGDAGGYTVVASNALGSVTSVTAQVTVNGAPRVPGAPFVERPSLLPSNSVVHALLALPDGKLLVGGSFSNFLGQSHRGLLRVNADGAYDSSFFPASNVVRTLALKEDGNIRSVDPMPGGTVLAVDQVGSTTRLLLGAARGTNFSRWSNYMWSDSRVSIPLAISRRGEVYVSRPRQIWRVHDNWFKSVYGEVYAMAFQPDGKLVLGGTFSSIGGPAGGPDLEGSVACTNVVRLLTNGLVDRTFFPDAGAIFALAVQPDGKTVVGGQFSSAGPMISRGVARFNEDGSVDSTFAPSPGVLGGGATVYALALQPDGRIVIGGTFTHYNGVPRSGLARVNPDGSLDETFEPGSGISGAAARVSTLTMAIDGTVYLGGSFTHFNGVPRQSFSPAYNNPRLYALQNDDASFSASFLSLLDRTYIFESRQFDGPWSMITTLNGDGTTKFVTDTNAVDATRFYRLRVE
jgi:uncharacterized delta-60 repeat protein